MAEITCYRPMNNFNAIAAPDSSCALNALWMERHQPWELGDATKSFMNNATTMEQRGSHYDLDSWNLAATNLHDSATFKEPRSVLDLQTSSLSSQHSFNSVSDGTSTALQTVTDQLLSDEQDSAFLVSTKSCTISAKPNSVLMDQNILTWMELMQDSEPDNIPESRQVTSDQSFISCADMDLDFNVGTMESIPTTPSSHQGTVTPTFEPLCDPTTAQNQTFSHNSPTLLSQASPGFQQSNDMNKHQVTTTTTTTTAMPSMFDSMNCAIPASQLQDYTVVPTAELLRLLSSQNQTTTTANPVKGGHGSTGQGTSASAGQIMSSTSNLKWNSALSTGVPQEQENGLHLVHLLLACAEAIDLCENTIAEPMLARLRFISAPEGDPMQRIALYFAEALSERLASEMAQSNEAAPAVESPGDALECDIAYQAYYQILPFEKFTHFTANQALLEVVANYPRVHIVDFNIRQGLQWPSFLQSLALLPQGPPQLRITAVQTDAAAAHVTGNRLAEFARSLQVPFEFHVIEETLESFHRGMISPRRDDEALAVNCSDILHRVLRKEGKLHSLLCKIRSLRPVVVTVLEADANHNVPSFMSRFVQALHYYCALFDSLETKLHRTSMDRLRIESLCFGAEIRSIVALEGVDREVRHVRAEAWQSLFRQAGFQEVPLSRYAADQAQLLLSLYETSDSMPFRLSPEFGGLSLGWQQTPVMMVSSWTC